MILLVAAAIGWATCLILFACLLHNIATWSPGVGHEPPPPQEEHYNPDNTLSTTDLNFPKTSTRRRDDSRTSARDRAKSYVDQGIALFAFRQYGPASICFRRAAETFASVSKRSEILAWFAVGASEKSAGLHQKAATDTYQKKILGTIKAIRQDGVVDEPMEKQLRQWEASALHFAGWSFSELAVEQVQKGKLAGAKADFLKAEEHYLEALAISPSYSKVFYNLAGLHIKWGRIANRKARWAAVKRCPTPETKETELIERLREDRENAQAHFQLATHYICRAEADLERRSNGSPPDPKARFTLAMVHASMAQAFQDSHKGVLTHADQLWIDQRDDMAKARLEQAILSPEGDPSLSYLLDSEHVFDRLKSKEFFPKLTQDAQDFAIESVMAGLFKDEDFPDAVQTKAR
ncbi:tetratricopeptide repeat protein [Elusimicrobiota bacterium]